MGLRERLSSQQTPMSSGPLEPSNKPPKVMDDMLAVLRDCGMPSIMIGAMKHGLKGMSEEQARGMCRRIGLGLCNIGAGGDVRDSLDQSLMADEATIDRIMGGLKAQVAPEVLELTE